MAVTIESLALPLGASINSIKMSRIVGLTPNIIAGVLDAAKPAKLVYNSDSADSAAAIDLFLTRSTGAGETAALPAPGVDKEWRKVGEFVSPVLTGNWQGNPSGPSAIYTLWERYSTA